LSMNKPFASGRSQLVGRGIVYPVPIPLDPAAYIGSLVNGRDPADNRVKLYYSDGTAWTRSIFDTEISEQIERFIDDLFLNGFDEEDMPDPTLLENLRRYAFNNTRGLPGFVWDNEWQYLVSEARFAELADDLIFNFVRFLEEPLEVTVHYTDPAADFQTIGQAFDFFALYRPASEGPDVLGTIKMLSGHVVTEPIVTRALDFGWVSLEAEDATVMVIEENLTRAATSGLGGTLRPLFEFIGPQAPLINCHFTSDGSKTESGIVTVGLLARKCLVSNRPAATAEDQLLMPDAGFSGFDINMSMRLGSAYRGFQNAKCKNARLHNLQVGSGSYGAIEGGDYAESGQQAFDADGGGMARIGLDADFRKSVSTGAQASDLRLRAGSMITLVGDVLCGLPQRHMLQTRDGLIVDRRNGGPSLSAAIVTDSNDNGSFTRFANGFQTCQRRVTLGARNALGAGTYADPFRTPQIDVPYAQPFTGTPDVSVDLYSDSGTAADRRMSAAVRRFDNTQVTQLQGIAQTSESGSGTVMASVIAHGPWL
jgi:hypothetical protein